MKCEFCGKIPRSGFNVSHSKRHTKRVWEPNIITTSVSLDGRKRKIRICSRCLRTRHKVSGT